MKAVKSFLSFFCLTLFLFLPLNASAQSITATLNGLVTDNTGAALPGAAVVLTSSTQGRRYHLKTNASGEFTFPLLQPDSYKLLVSHPGFRPLQVLSVPLHVDDVKTMSVKMQVGLVKDEVTVTAAADLLNTSQQVSTSIDKNFVQEIPVAGRSLQSLILLSPGVVAAPLIQGGVGQFSVNGQRTDANYFTVDGASANNGTVPASGVTNAKYLAGTLPELNAVGTTSSLISIDALDQFTLVTSSASAESGRQSGGQVQLLSSAGSNQYHGTAFDFLRNELFDARSYYQRTCTTAGVCKTNPKTKTRQNDFGGRFSGPLRIPFLYNGTDKTFFFFDYEAQRLLSPTSANTYVPSVSFRAKAVAAGSAVAPVLAAFPLPNGAVDSSGNWANYIDSISTPYNTNATSIRVDQNAGDKLHLFARYSYAPSFGNSRTAILPSLVTSTQQDAISGTVGATYTFTPHLANEFTVNYTRNQAVSRNYFDNFGGAVPVSASTLDAPYAGTGTTFATFSLSYNSHSSTFSIGDSNVTLQRQSQVTDHVSYTVGKHTLRVGADIRLLAPIYQPIGYQGTYSFYSAANVVNSILSNYTLTASQEEHLHYHYFSLFAQDSWKPTNRLSLDYGIRWDLDPPPSEESGRRPAFIIVPDPNDLSTARLATPSDPYYKTSLGAVAPRFGGAYIVHATPGAETVVRGGIGLYFDPNNDVAASGYSSYPFVNSVSNFAQTPYPLTTAKAVAPSEPTLTLPVSAYLPALEPNLDLPFNMQWNVTLQQALHGQSLSIAYVGSTGRRMLTTQQLNAPEPTTATNPSPQPPNPNFGRIQYSFNQPTSNYHSLQVQFIRPLNKGLQALVNYTWSHAIDDVSNDVNTGTLDRGNADFDVRHSFTAAFLYTPTYQRSGSGFVNGTVSHLANGWHLSGFAIAHTGTPGNVTAGTYTGPNGETFAARPDLVPGVPLWLPAPGIVGGKKANVAAFTLPTLYNPGYLFSFCQTPGCPQDLTDFARQGTTPRNYLRMPGLYQFNVAVARQVQLTERANLQLRVEAYDVTNHASAGYYNLSWSAGSSLYGVPAANQTASSGGNGTNPLYNLGGPRSIQLSAKLQF